MGDYGFEGAAEFGGSDFPTWAHVNGALQQQQSQKDQTMNDHDNDSGDSVTETQGAVESILADLGNPPIPDLLRAVNELRRLKDELHEHDTGEDVHRVRELQMLRENLAAERQQHEDEVRAIKKDFHERMSRVLNLMADMEGFIQDVKAVRFTSAHVAAAEFLREINKKRLDAETERRRLAETLEKADWVDLGDRIVEGFKAANESDTQPAPQQTEADKAIDGALDSPKLAEDLHNVASLGNAWTAELEKLETENRKLKADTSRLRTVIAGMEQREKKLNGDIDTLRALNDTKVHRKRLPGTRPSITHKRTICGLECYVNVGFYDGDGDHADPAEVFVTVGKHGDVLAGLIDGWAVNVSLLLQHGVPFEQIEAKFQGTSFGTSDVWYDKDNDESVIQSSVYDGLVKAIRYVIEHRREIVGLDEIEAGTPEDFWEAEPSTSLQQDINNALAMLGKEEREALKEDLRRYHPGAALAWDDKKGKYVPWNGNGHLDDNDPEGPGPAGAAVPRPEPDPTPAISAAKELDVSPRRVAGGKRGGVMMPHWPTMTDEEAIARCREIAASYKAAHGSDWGEASQCSPLAQDADAIDRILPLAEAGAKLRPSVRMFAQQMEDTLHKHSDKKGNQNGANRRSGWRQDPVHGLVDHAAEELYELRQALLDRKATIGSAAGEAVDLANMAMMVWDKLLERHDAEDPVDWDDQKRAAAESRRTRAAAEAA